MAEKKYTRIVVEENNEHGFDSYRVPGIVTASNGDLLLTYEGRKDGGNSRTLFLRRYRMTGETIEPIGERVTMVSPKDDELIHNPLLIAAAEGKLYFFWCQDYKRLFLKESDDNGVSFGTERELTSLIDGFRKEWPVTLWAIAPGHGISKKDGTLILPLWLSRGENAHLPACFRRETGLAIPQKAPWQNGVMEHCLQPCAMKFRESEEELFVKAKKR